MENGLSQSTVKCIYQDEFHMMWIGTQDGLNRYNGHSISVFRPVKGDSTSIFSNNIRSICGDRNGHIYVHCKFAVSAFDLRTEKFKTLVTDDVQAIVYGKSNLWICLSSEILSCHNGNIAEYFTFDDIGLQISCAFETSNGELYIGTNSSGLFVIDKNKKILQILSNEHVIKVYEDSKKNTWVATQYNGLYKMDRNGNMVNYRYAPGNPASLSDNYVRDICEDSQGNHWIATFKGINILDNNMQTMRYVDHQEHISYSLSHSSVWCITKDHQGTLWIGAYFGGVNIFNEEYEFFTYYYPNDTRDDQLNSSVLGQIVEDSQQNLWICTEGGGLNFFTKKENKFMAFQKGAGSVSSNVTQSLYLDEEQQVLWIGTLLGGLNKMDLKTKNVRTFMHNSSDANSLHNNNIRKIVPVENLLLLATHRGVAVFDKTTETFRLLIENDASVNRYISDMLIDHEHNCWFVTSNGVFKHNLNTGALKSYFVEDTKDIRLGSNRMMVCFQDRKKRIWFGSTGSGLFLYDLQNDNFANFDSHNSNLINDYILDIDESPSGYLLLAINGGFVRYDPEIRTFYNYNRINGFPIADINPNGLFVSKNNMIYLSGSNVLISFDERVLTTEIQPFDVYFTSLSVNNKPVHPSGPDNILKESLLYQSDIDLYDTHTVFSILYATSNYVPYFNRNVEYMLEGFDTEWVKGNKSQQITYTNLHAGTYRLIIRIKEEDAILNQRILTIKVHPPFYQNIWAYIIYTISIIGVIMAFLQFYSSKLKLTGSLEIEKREKKQIEELNQSKLRFFTNVSHELRTPITLIISQIEMIFHQGNIPPVIYNKLLSILRNSSRIRKLINELLEFKKQEQDVTVMQFSKQNMVETLRKTYYMFKDYADYLHVNFNFMALSEDIEAWYDEEQMETVICNLLSNAFKFTPEHGLIKLSVQQQENEVLIQIRDSGIGISPEYMDKIFDPFYQIPTKKQLQTGSPGTGIGLSLAKKIVEAHHGKIRAESQSNIGTLFSITFPIDDKLISENEKMIFENVDDICMKADTPDDHFFQEIKENQNVSGTPDTIMLIVEDNDELRNHLKELFSPLYKVITASNGMEAWGKALQLQPDIILSDLIMPHITGNELCTRIKSSFETCHIPFVMLTAKAAIEYTLEGLKYGADDYITKPFDTRILITRCSNLVNGRKMMQRKLAQSPDSGLLVEAINPLDQALFEKAIKIVEENLTNSQFSVELFAQEMALSRTNLFLKIKGLTGQTPNDFIISIRLNKAKLLLKNVRKLSVGDISYTVGFSSASYFIRSFSKLYGITPVQYRNKTE
jgi:signal transduction histidine kinase/ligand-binding sensor domain-containing protein/DNA-binding response OmpR family regulator